MDRGREDNWKYQISEFPLGIRIEPTISISPVGCSLHLATRIGGELGCLTGFSFKPRCSAWNFKSGDPEFESHSFVRGRQLLGRAYVQPQLVCLLPFGILNLSVLFQLFISLYPPPPKESPKGEWSIKNPYTIKALFNTITRNHNKFMYYYYYCCYHYYYYYYRFYLEKEDTFSMPLLHLDWWIGPWQSPTPIPVRQPRSSKSSKE